LTEGALAAPASLEGATNRLWRRIRGPIDLVYVDPGASGELLAARARVPIAFLLILIHLLPGWPTGPDLAVLVLALAILGYAVLVRRAAASNYTSTLGYATSVLDVTAVTASLAFMGLSDPLSPLRSIVRFDLYFLAISTSSLKMNWRICAVASGLAFIQYAGLLAVVASAAGAGINWAIQAGRLGALLGAGYLSVVVVLRAQQLRDLSTRDFLTGLANRAVLDSRLAEELSRASRHRRRFSLALLDVDHFKRFNDAHGHAVGDEVLRGLAEVLKTSVRESDLVARYGGEEFALLLPEARVGEACAKLEALRLLVEATPFSESVEGPCHRVTLSAGVAEFPADGASVAELLAAADGRLYQAKRAGRNRVEAGLASKRSALPRA
jgi:diguanylate cyclase (GGDEF)-like protein